MTLTNQIAKTITQPLFTFTVGSHSVVKWWTKKTCRNSTLLNGLFSHFVGKLFVSCNCCYTWWPRRSLQYHRRVSRVRTSNRKGTRKEGKRHRKILEERRLETRRLTNLMRYQNIFKRIESSKENAIRHSTSHKLRYASPCISIFNHASSIRNLNLPSRSQQGNVISLLDM